MVFKRRTKRSWRQVLTESVWPRGGWTRAVSYIWHRLRRLPDPPHRIARGVAVGVFASFTPFYGFHFVLAGIFAYFVRGNVLAALMATFVGNPVTFPLIATVSVELGSWMLGLPGDMPLYRIVGAFSQASLELWTNTAAIFTSADAHWDRLGALFNHVFLPYLIGGIIPGLVTATVFYMITHRVISAYQHGRIARLRRRVEKRRAAQAAALAATPPVCGGEGSEGGKMTRLRLGVNIDHVATVRNARGSAYPDPVRAALVAEAAGADGITAHLREDRRHISDADIDNLMSAMKLPLNLEMAATPEMQAIALRHRPHAVCLVPEKREERTTEGGLEVAREENRLAHFIAPLADAGCRVSIFIAADRAQIESAARIGAAVVELHTGAYCDFHAEGRWPERDAELARLTEMATFADALGLEVHAGHGLTYDTVAPVAALPEVRELNIGHFLVGEAIFLGLGPAIAQMRRLMDNARPT